MKARLLHRNQSLLLIGILSLTPIYIQAQTIYESPVWSPTRNELVYTQSNEAGKHLFLYDVATQTTRQLTTAEGNHSHAAWPPDGNRLAFTSDRDGNREVYIINRTGKKDRRLTNTEWNESAPSWTPDGKAVGYCYFDQQKDSSLITTSHLISVKGAYVRELGPSDYFSIYPKFHPDGNHLLFTSKPRSGGRNKLFVYNEQSQEMTKIVDIPIACYNGSWSVSGDKVIFINQAGQSLTTATVYVYDMASKETKQVVITDFGCFQPSFSKDGKRIAYCNGWEEGHQGIFIYDLDTQTNTRLSLK